MRHLIAPLSALALLALTACTDAPPDGAKQRVTLLNVSYDPTRELYEELNVAFARKWLAEQGQVVTINQSHGGSGKQARAVIDGLEADVVTLALSRDIDVIADKARLLPVDWQKRLPHASAPFSSTIVFVVRAGNPKNIKDWSDVVRDDVDVITPNPKTSGGARWNYLAAWSYALGQNGGDSTAQEAAAQELVKKLFARVPVLDTGARGSTTTFAERGIGDVLLAWESEALLLTSRSAKAGEGFEIVVPSSSIRAEPPVAVVDKNVDRHGTRAVAQAYVEFLYTDEAQEIAVKHHYRPSSEEAKAKHAAAFPPVLLVGIEQLKGWREAQRVHFDDGGFFDVISATVASAR